MANVYHHPDDWYREHHHELKAYVGQWIAFSKEGVIAHDRDYRIMRSQITPDFKDFIIERIFENEFVERPKFYPVRFKTFKAHEWQPKYSVGLKAANSVTIKILVDSGADFCLISKQLGIDLGYQMAMGESIEKADGVGGTVEYLLRRIEITIDNHNFMAPVAWLQSDDSVDNLLGREVVFDLFDIEFKQADEQIIFKFRE